MWKLSITNLMAVSKGGWKYIFFMTCLCINQASKAASGKAGIGHYSKPTGCSSWGILRHHQQEHLYHHPHMHPPQSRTQITLGRLKICKAMCTTSTRNSAFIIRHCTFSKEKKIKIIKTNGERCHALCCFTAVSCHPGDPVHSLTRSMNPKQVIRSTHSQELLAVLAD